MEQADHSDIFKSRIRYQKWDGNHDILAKYTGAKSLQWEEDFQGCPSEYYQLQRFQNSARSMKMDSLLEPASSGQ